VCVPFAHVCSVHPLRAQISNNAWASPLVLSVPAGLRMLSAANTSGLVSLSTLGGEMELQTVDLSRCQFELSGLGTFLSRLDKLVNFRCDHCGLTGELSVFLRSLARTAGTTDQLKGALAEVGSNTAAGNTSPHTKGGFQLTRLLHVRVLLFCVKISLEQNSLTASRLDELFGGFAVANGLLALPTTLRALSLAGNPGIGGMLPDASLGTLDLEP
jgi:hypothetical protein